MWLYVATCTISRVQAYYVASLCTIVLDHSFDVHIEGSPTGSKGTQQTGYVCILQNPVSETPKNHLNTNIVMEAFSIH